MKHSVSVHGEGVLFDTLRSVLSAAYDVQPFDASKTQTAQPLAVISAYDYRALDLELDLQKQARQLGVPYLRVHLHTDRSYTGPWVLPEESGCVKCVERRLRTAHPGRDMWASIEAVFGGERYRQADKPWSEAFLELTAMMVAEELHALAEHRALRLQGQLYVGTDGAAKGRLHRFHPDSTCPHCSQRPDDTAEAMELHFQELTKPHPRAYRLPNPAIKQSVVRDAYYDWRTGIFNHIYRDVNARYMPVTGAELPLYDQRKLSEIGYGRTMTYEESELTSMLEGLERYAGMTPRGKKTVHRGSYRQLREQGAIDPRSLHPQDPSQYGEPGYEYLPYDEDLEFNWIWAYSWKEQRPVLIPEQAIYYRIETPPERPVNRFLYETSNGCAMGGSLEEAVYYALMEVIERDSFLVSWYNRLQLTELSIDDVEDRDLLLMRDRIEADGYRLHLFDMTMDTGIPSVWALMINTADDAKVKTYSAAGAHPNPEKAIHGAMVEVITSVPVYETSLPQERARAEQMVSDPSLVQTMHDHVLLYSHPDTLSRFDFLFEAGRTPRPVREVYADWYDNTPSDSFTAELQTLLDRILETNQDIYIVDETPAELGSIGVNAVKVIVSGMLTMTFGHQYRRVVIDRVQQTPVRTGHRSEPISLAELNLDPHPFP